MEACGVGKMVASLGKRCARKWHQAASSAIRLSLLMALVCLRSWLVAFAPHVARQACLRCGRSWHVHCQLFSASQQVSNDPSWQTLSNIWVWVKIKPPGDRRFWSIFPFTRVPLGYSFLTHSHISSTLCSQERTELPSGRPLVFFTLPLNDVGHPTMSSW